LFTGLFFGTSRIKESTRTIHMSGSDMNGHYSVQANSASDIAHNVSTGLSWFSLIILTGLGLIALLPVVLLVMIVRKGNSTSQAEDKDLRQVIDDLHALSERMIKRVDNLETILSDDSKDTK